MAITLEMLKARRQAQGNVETLKLGDDEWRVKRWTYEEFVQACDTLNDIKDLDEQNTFVIKACILNGTDALLFPADSDLGEYLEPMERVQLAGFAKRVNGLGIAQDEDTVKNSDSGTTSS